MIRTAAWPLLLPPALAYGGLAAAHRGIYRRGWIGRRRLERPVICVGGLSLGGDGKTPVTREIVRRLQQRGLRVGVVAAGYGASVAGVHRLTAEARWEPMAGRFGDEAPMLAGWLPEALVFVGADKSAASAAAVAAGAQAVVVDDGFQHHRLQRSLDVLVGRRPWLPPPAGSARELPFAAQQADLCWWHARAGLAGRPPGSPGVVSATIPVALRDQRGAWVGWPDALRGTRVFLIAGVARPADFVGLVRSLGATVVGQRFVRDHRPLPLSGTLLRRAALADLLLCTEKDAARMSGRAAAAPLVHLACDIRLVSGSAALDRGLERALC
jgi:tetraacyldisaccharide 4'-kinase